MRARLTRVGLVTASLGALAGFLPPDKVFVPILLGVALWLLSEPPVWCKWVSMQKPVKSRDVSSSAGSSSGRKGLDRLQQGLQAEGRKQRLTAAELEGRLQTYQLVDEMLESIPQRWPFRRSAK
jgi:hypothetical protein